ncbi:Ribosome maturation factor RimM [Ascidiaceihabitans donghaensis]|uniref:Ribosome maturation factor RimM n=1 Tax=Ascidiaceihabitans donghaensis TaxID=1510460 RepID=A0A2R8BAR0_9RHOB|nr:ribosome maturation factor RimM [Ascidiaceihabitans donghaensis]SPH19969.1 Ribosome maturation factor RimM [Ascidiaceihabitans donghaensis]
MRDEMICVGAVSGSYGVQGEVRIKSFCATPEDIETYSPLTCEHGVDVFHLSLIRPIKNGFVARLVEVKTKEQGDALKGTQLFARRAQLPSLPDDEYYHSDLVGLTVSDTGGTLIGTVKSVQNHGATDLLEIQSPGSSATILLPFTLAAVPTVDLDAGRIVADPPDGVL